MAVAELHAHPSTPATAIRRVVVDARRAADGLALAFHLEGALDRIVVPPSRPPRAADLLWQHTCCEAFVGPADGPAYEELNLSPSGEWARYAFARYRERAADGGAPVAPSLAVQCGAGRLVLDAVLPLGPAYRGTPVRLGLAAVIEATDGGLSYWALHHPPGAPDFHHPAGFVLRLEDAS